MDRYGLRYKDAAHGCFERACQDQAWDDARCPRGGSGCYQEDMIKRYTLQLRPGTTAAFSPGKTNLHCQLMDKMISFQYNV